MYKAVYELQKDCWEKEEKRIFAPFLMCYHLHTIDLMRNGLSQLENDDFNIKELNEIDKAYISFDDLIKMDDYESLILSIDYFYKRADSKKILDFKFNELKHTYKWKNIDKSIEIASTHYMDAQFSLDNGLYKNAVLNFGIVLESLANTDLDGNFNLKEFTESYSKNQRIKSEMNEIREYRNKVHPNKIFDISSGNNIDITRKDAIKCRNYMEKILKLFN